MESSKRKRCAPSPPQLSITWRVNTAEHIVEKLNIPEDLIRCGGQRRVGGHWRAAGGVLATEIAETNLQINSSAH